MPDLLTTEIPGVYVPDYSVYASYPFNLSNDGDWYSIYVTDLFGMPFHFEIYYPLLATLLAAVRLHREIQDIEGLPLMELTRPRLSTIEISGEHYPLDYCSASMEYTLESLFLDDWGNFSIPQAVELLMGHLVRWRVSDVVQSTIQRMTRQERYCVDTDQYFTSTGDTGSVRMYNPLYTEMPPKNDYPPEFGVMDDYISPDGFIFNHPIKTVDDDAPEETGRIMWSFEGESATEGLGF